MTSPGARKRNTQGVLGKARRMRWLWRNIADWNLMTTFRPRVGAPIARSSVRRPATLPWITHTATHSQTNTQPHSHSHPSTSAHQHGMQSSIGIVCVLVGVSQGGTL